MCEGGKKKKSKKRKNLSNVINVENILNNEYVSIENNFNDFLRDTTSDGISNIAEFVTVYTTNQEINYFESDLHDQNYEENIKKKRSQFFMSIV